MNVEGREEGTTRVKKYGIQDKASTDEKKSHTNGAPGQKHYSPGAWCHEQG